jgi:hypothetical protein
LQLPIARPTSDRGVLDIYPIFTPRNIPKTTPNRVGGKEFFSSSLEQEDLFSIESEIITFFSNNREIGGRSGGGGVGRFPNYNKGGN